MCDGSALSTLKEELLSSFIIFASHCVEISEIPSAFFIPCGGGGDITFIFFVAAHSQR